MVKTELGEYELDSDIKRMQFDLIHSWLTATYWSPGIAHDRVVRAAENSSLLVGIFQSGRQVGYLRVVSDRTTFAWLCDVYVMNAHRGKGLAKAMVRFALADPEHQGLRRWLLATQDAHAIYEACGFTPLALPERWMALV